MNHSYNKFYIKDLQDEIGTLVNEIKLLKKENEKLQKRANKAEWGRLTDEP